MSVRFDRLITNTDDRKRRWLRSKTHTRDRGYEQPASYLIFSLNKKKRIPWNRDIIKNVRMRRNKNWRHIGFVKYGRYYEISKSIQVTRRSLFKHKINHDFLVLNYRLWHIWQNKLWNEDFHARCPKIFLFHSCSPCCIFGGKREQKKTERIGTTPSVPWNMKSLKILIKPSFSHPKKKIYSN